MRSLFIGFLFFSFSLSLQAAVQGPSKVKGYDYYKNEVQSYEIKKDHRVLVFLSTTCPCSHSHLKYLSKLAEEHPSIQFVGVHSNRDESFENGKKYFNDNTVGFPVIRDEKSKIVNQFGGLKTPHVFIQDKSGEIFYSGPATDSHVVEAANKHYLKDILAQISTGKKIAFKQRKPLGCEITR